jgi:hypothetical protein
MTRVTLMLIFSGALLGFSVSLLLPTHYVGTVTAAFAQPTDHPEQLLKDAFARTTSKESLVALTVQSAYLRPRLDYTPIEEMLQSVRDNAEAHLAGPRNFTVQFRDDDKDAALDTARNLLIEVGRNAAKLEHAPEPSGLSAPPRARPAGFTGSLLTLIGSGTGLLGAALIRLFRRC